MAEGFCDVDFSDYGDDAEPVEFVNTTDVTARKEHRCDECREPIRVGERHQKRVYRFDGAFCSERVCAACQEAAREFGYSVLGGLLWEQFQDAWSEGANVQGCINRLATVAAKQRMHQQWQKWQDATIARRRRALELRKSVDAVDPVDGVSTK